MKRLYFIFCVCCICCIWVVVGYRFGSYRYKVAVKEALSVADKCIGKLERVVKSSQIKTYKTEIIGRQVK